MKRVWAAVAVLAVLVALCILGLVTTVTAADEMLHRTEQIETCLRQSQYEEAAALTEDAIDRWERKSRILFTFFSHLQLETADKEWDALRASLEAKEYGPWAGALRATDVILESLTKSGFSVLGKCAIRKQTHSRRILFRQWVCFLAIILFLVLRCKVR